MLRYAPTKTAKCALRRASTLSRAGLTRRAGCKRHDSVVKVASGSNEDSKAALAAAFPVTGGDATLAYIGIVEGPEGPRACLCLTVKDGNEVAWEVEQNFDLDGLDPAEIATWGERARQRLAGLTAADACTTPAALVVPPFRRLAALPVADEELVPSITEALRTQAIASGFDTRFERLALWPTIPRTIYFLDLAYAMLGGNGFEVFLAQQCFEDVVGVLEALEESDCERLALRMRQGIELCFEDGGAEFLVEVDEDWLESNGRPMPDGDERDWERIDSHEPGGTWWLVDHELQPALEQYVREHLGALVE
jgi:hypothetical protein